jgi:anti-anti-sigma factor
MFNVVVNHSANRTEIRFGGTIDHECAVEFGRAFEDLRGAVCLDLMEVKYISSYGVGLLLKHLSAISRQHKVEFARCSETMVDQFSMLQFSNYGRITSFQARYACPRCERTDVVLLEVKQLKVDVAARTVESPVYPCRCGGKMAVDDSLEFVIDHVR